jgi:membrane protease YdiL (CAAX protease family)
VAAIAVAAWLAITILGGVLQGGGTSSLDTLVTQGPLWGVWAALAALTIVARSAGWTGLGFARPDWAASVRLMWLPGLFVLGFTTVALLGTLPSPPVIGWVLVNCALVGISEEFAYRGVLLRPLRLRYSLLTAAAVSSVVFGFSHALNGFVTGNFASAMVQAVAASMSGLLFFALRVRTGSLLPGMLLHGLWDASLFILGQSVGGMNDTSAPATGAALWLGPLVIGTPSFLYACYLLRPAKRDAIPAAG